MAVMTKQYSGIRYQNGRHDETIWGISYQDGRLDEQDGGLCYQDGSHNEQHGVTASKMSVITSKMAATVPKL
jgi:hypothetical protein